MCEPCTTDSFTYLFHLYSWRGVSQISSTAHCTNCLYLRYCVVSVQQNLQYLTAYVQHSHKNVPQQIPDLVSTITVPSLSVCFGAMCV